MKRPNDQSSREIKFSAGWESGILSPIYYRTRVRFFSSFASAQNPRIMIRIREKPGRKFLRGRNGLVLPLDPRMLGMLIKSVPDRGIFSHRSSTSVTMQPSATAEMLLVASRAPSRI